MNTSPMLLTDFYKIDHRSQYPENTTVIYSNFTPRKSRIKDIDEVVFFGLQYFIKEYLMEGFDKFFKEDKEVAVKRYRRLIDGTLGKGKIDIKNVEELHDLGYLPLKIKALPEGTRCPIGVPMLTVVNTLPNFYWLTNFIESLMSTVIWMPITSATIASQYRKILDKFAIKTVGNTDFVQWQAHDFSFRGMAGLEAAMISGAGHLLSFTGTDTIPAISFLEEYYNADVEKELIGSSVMATEHSVMMAGGKENERETYRRLIEESYPDGILSIVSDTWDLWNVLTNILPSLKDSIMKRNGKVVVRPDSGDPVNIICGTSRGVKELHTTNLSVYYNGKHYYDNSDWGDDCNHILCDDKNIRPSQKGVIELLWDQFGGTINEQGYKVLDTHVGAIYGDSITMERAQQICERLEAKGFASTNVVLGVGSYSYQYNTRDTFGMAMKATYCEIDGESKAIFKDPITDDGTKKSLKGLLMVYLQDGKLRVKDNATAEEENKGELKVVYQDGVLIKDWTLAEIRERVKL